MLCSSETRALVVVHDVTDIDMQCMPTGMRDTSFVSKSSQREV